MRIFSIAMALAFAGFVVCAEEVKWYSGAFEDESGKKTTASTIVGKDGDATKYVFGFSNPKSNTAFAQFLLKPEAGKNALRLLAKSKEGKVNAEVWIETKGWKFQGKILIHPGKFSEIVLPLKQCKSNEVKYMRIAVPNKDNPERGMLFLKNPELCDTKIVKKRIWYTGIFKAEEKSSCKQAEAPDGAVKFSWNFAGDKSGPVSLSTKFESNEDCKKFEFNIKNAGTEAAELEIWIESKSGWKFQGKVKAASTEWKTVQYKLLETKSTDTKYFRVIANSKGNPRTGAVFIKNVKYVK